MRRILLTLLLCTFTAITLAQPRVVDLKSELDAGRVRLTSIAGNGGSSGTVITARLQNVTSSELRIEVHLTQSLYLVNSGSSQDMIASQVFFDGGRYQSDGKKSFLVVPPRATSSVVFMAYCADFEKDNPTDHDRFYTGIAPPNLTSVLDKVRAYLRANPDADVVVATQAAIWLAQGVSLEKIRTKFPVSATEAQLARHFAR